MKHLLTFGMTTAFFCFSLFASAQKVKVKQNDDEIKLKSKGNMAVMKEQNMLYSPTYSAQFVPGNQQYATLVLKAWKDFENNTLDNSGGMLADSMTAILLDGTTLEGKEAFLNAVKGYRGSFSSMKTSVAAWLPIRSIDQGRETVCIWGSETSQKSDGTSQTVVVHELWFFNKEGKVDLFRQFVEQNPHK